jgi:S1-C subfamily serine protease
MTAVVPSLPPPPDLFGRVANYLDTQGFPQVFAGFGGATAPPVDPPGEGSVALRQPRRHAVDGADRGARLRRGVIRQRVVVQPGFIVTNAHVVAGAEVVNVRDGGGTHDAVPIHVDANLDLAVLSSPASTATPLPWTGVPADRGTAGRRSASRRAAAAQHPAGGGAGRQEALGRDIYGQGSPHATSSP